MVEIKGEVFLSIDIWELILDYLINHPYSVVHFDETYYRYNEEKNYIEYCKPTNKKCNGWYCARGLYSRAYIYGHNLSRPT